MSDRPDWTSWILQKNTESKVEELKKSDSVMLEKAKIPGVSHGSYELKNTTHVGTGEDKDSDRNIYRHDVHHNGVKIGHVHTISKEGNHFLHGSNLPSHHEHAMTPLVHKLTYS
jgi:NAD-dependent DNA ligase